MKKSRLFTQTEIANCIGPGTYRGRILPKSGDRKNKKDA